MDKNVTITLIPFPSLPKDEGFEELGELNINLIAQCFGVPPLFFADEGLSLLNRVIAGFQALSTLQKHNRYWRDGRGG